MTQKNNTTRSETFCALPWTHISSRPNGNALVCCRSNSGIVDTSNQPMNYGTHSIQDVWNSDHMKQLRLQMLAGQKPSGCQRCFQEEESGIKSKRQWETEKWEQLEDLDEFIKNTDQSGHLFSDPVYFDLRFGNTCNLMCSMCGPGDSSRWISQFQNWRREVKNPTIQKALSYESNATFVFKWYEKNNEYWDDFYRVLPGVKQLYFAGGEPLLIKQHYEILEYCVNHNLAGNIELRYNTNGTHVDEKLINLWSKFQKVFVSISIDEMGTRNDWIRYPSKWDDMITVLDLLDKSPDNIDIHFARTAQLTNFFYLPEFIKWKINYGFKKINPFPIGAGLCNIHLLFQPQFLSIKVYPQELKQEIEHKFDNLFEWLSNNYRNDQEFLSNPDGIERFRSFITFMNSEDWSHLIPDFKDYVQLMDQTRSGLLFENAFPELRCLIE